MTQQAQAEALALHVLSEVIAKHPNDSLEANACSIAKTQIERLSARVRELEKERKPLTDEQIENLLVTWPKDGIAFFDFARAIERAHGIGVETK